jgi:hypothetical protein
MKRILCLALPALLVAGCGSSADSATDTRPPDAVPEVGKQDAAPVVPDAPGNPDSYVAADFPAEQVDVVPRIDGPMQSPDLPPLIDSPSVDVPAPGDTPTVDAPPPIDGPLALDGLTSAIDAEIRTLRSPDGRTWTVIIVDACDAGPITPSSECPATYAEGRTKLASAMDAGLPFNFGTAIGRCAEGSFIYAPYWGLETVFCYYDANTQGLVGSLNGSDTTSECGSDGTASNSRAHGDVPPCTNITWEIEKLPY